MEKPKVEMKAEQKKAMANAMKGISSFIAYMIADFALIAGIVLILFGVGDYLSSLINIPGLGKVALGFVLVVIALIVLSRSRARIQIGMQPPIPPVPPEESAPVPNPNTPIGIYR